MGESRAYEMSAAPAIRLIWLGAGLTLGLTILAAAGRLLGLLDSPSWSRLFGVAAFSIAFASVVLPAETMYRQRVPPRMPFWIGGIFIVLAAFLAWGAIALGPSETIKMYRGGWGPFWPGSVLWVPGITLQAVGTIFLWCGPPKPESSKRQRHRGVRHAGE